MLDRLTPNHGSRRARKRVGRGIGSGWGKTCGRGTKGAGARSGFKRRVWFEGGQMPLARRLPKRGFHNLFRAERHVVNLQALAGFPSGAEIDAEVLANAGITPRGDHALKVLGEGDISVPLKLRVHAISGSARAKIEAAGGSVEIIPPSNKLERVKKS